MNHIFIGAGVATIIAMHPVAAEAARCPSGQIYRPSIKQCWAEERMRKAGFVRVTPPVRKARSIRKPRLPVYTETFENVVWNWVEANRDDLIRSYSR